MITNSMVTTFIIYIFLNYICSQSAHRSMGKKLIKCKNYESSESNCDWPQNDIFFSHENIFPKFVTLIYYIILI